MSAHSRVVVVGASLAGLRAAESVRKNGHRGEVVVIGDEPWMPYNRPPLSKDALAGEPAFGDLALRAPRGSFDIEFRLGTAVTACDTAAGSVTTATGERVAWAGLVVASGLGARTCAIPGPAGGRHVVRTLADAVGLRDAMRTAGVLVVIGAGFVGCEVAATARGMGLDVVVVAPERVPLERPLGSDLGHALQQRHEREGVRFRLGVVPVAFTGADRVASVVLSDGSEVAADLVVEAIGGAPNTSWLEGNGFDLADGVLCDNTLRAIGHSHVVACGDIARFPNPWSGPVPRRVEHWTMAIDTAKRAGKSLVQDLSGAPRDAEPFAPMPSFWSDQYGTRIQSFGSTADGTDATLLEGRWNGECAVGYYREAQLSGVVMVGLAHRLRHYRQLVVSAGDLAPSR